MDSALHQLHPRLDAQGFETRATDDELIVMTPATDDGAPRLADVITCLPRPDDEGRLWFFASGTPIEPAVTAANLVDAAMRIGKRLVAVESDQ